VRFPGHNWLIGKDPLFKTGIVSMAVALTLAVVAVVILVVQRDDGTDRAAAATGPESNRSSVEPQARSYRLPVKAEPQQVRDPQPESEPKPDPQPERQTPQAEGTDWEKPTDEELEAASRPRHYTLPPGAIMGLTVSAMGIHNVPVFDSDSQWALQNGIAHVPETSLPWSPTPQRNVYLAGHRMGFRGTWSRMVFYHLDKLTVGDEVLLKDRHGKTYRYRVSEIFVADPTESWTMGQIKGRDMVTLQTCTPIPTFERRLIVRADRA